jgi:polysaccharide pyruvyl transferase WcaK-like protein
MCDFFVGSRMHACIAALSQGIPTVGVAYSRKFAGVFDIVGAADWVVDGRTATDGEAVERIAVLFARRGASRALLRATVPAAKAELSLAFKGIVGTRSPLEASRGDSSRTRNRSEL